MIIKSSYASNYDLIKCIEKSNGYYLINAQKAITEHEIQLIWERMHSDKPYLVPGDAINQNSMFTAFKPYLESQFVIFNDENHLNKGLQPET